MAPKKKTSHSNTERTNYFGIFNIIPILINATILYYVFKLDYDNCVCSNNWRKLYIQVYLVVVSLIYLLMPLLRSYYNIGLSFIMMLAGAFNIYVIWSYLDMIRDCGCAKTGNLKYLYEFVKYYNYVQIVMLAIIVIMQIVFFSYRKTL